MLDASRLTDSWIFPDWPAVPRVHAAVTTRHGPGVSAPPFERFNLGLRSGDAVDAVVANRGALQQALALPVAPRWLRQVHGTTVATNTIIEGKTAACGFLTTKGFRDVLYIRDEHRYDMFDPQIEYSEPLVPRELTL